MKRTLLICLLSLSFVGNSQDTDTLKFVNYNILNFPGTTPERVDTLKVIMDYLKPDVLMVCELLTGAGADDILFNALNVDGETAYEAAAFVDGPDTDNGLFYNGDKLVLHEQNEISTVLRDINEYVLYHKADDLATAEDTVFFYIYVCHLKASTGFESQRNEEAQAMKDYIATRPHAENIIIAGDMNFYGSSVEPAWNTILSGSGVNMKDPISSPGDWHTNAGYAPIHTQSTRTAAFGGGSTGGMDDRFDFIFIQPEMTGWSMGAKYITGSYKAVGQDALHFNKALIDAPTNTIAPWNVITALYHMSDHLPVVMDVEVANSAVGIEDIDEDPRYYYDPKGKKIVMMDGNGFTSGKANLYSMSGQIVKSFDFDSTDVSFDISDVEDGGYIFKIEDGSTAFRFVKN